MLKKIVSLTLFFSLFFMLLTALVVFIEPPARVASWSDWTFLGLSRAHWDGAHLGMGLLFLVAGVAHVVLNWEELLDHLRNKAGALVIFTKPFFLSLALTVAVFAAALAGLPPVRQMVALSAFIKEHMAETYGEPPYSQAERSSLEDFSRRMGIDSEKALALLRLRNIKADSASQTLAEIARQNGVAPGGVFEALKMVMETSGSASSGLPKDPPPGLGRRKLSDICEEYGLDQAATIAKLAAAGIKAQPAWTLADVAKANNMLPIAVYEALRAQKPTAVQVEVSSSPVEPQPEAPAQPPAQQPAQPPAQQQAQQPAPTPAQPAAPQPAPGTGQPAQAQAPQPSGPAQPGLSAGPYQASLPNEAPHQGPSAQPPAYPGQPGSQPGAGGQVAAHPVAPPPGLERMMLQTFCREYDIPLSVAVQRLAKHGITAFGDMTFEELSLENNRTPADILRLATGQ